MKFINLICMIYSIIFHIVSNMKNSAFLKNSLKVNKNTALDFTYYHKTDEIYGEIRKLMNGKCQKKMKENSFIKSSTYEEGLKNNFKGINDFNGVLSSFDLNFDNNDNSQEKDNVMNANKNKKIKVFIISGEHARELISVELLYQFVMLLCEDTPLSNHILKNFSFRIIPISNPLGRKKVEEGDYCKRTNLNNVDPNRNWDQFWKKTQSVQENSGDYPFSEIETQFSKEQLEKFKPEVFLTLHSGIYGLFYPYGSSMKEAEVNGFEMKSILNDIKNNLCKWCSVGTPSQYLNYISPGNCLDYAYDKLKVKYSFAWEIYSDEVNYKEELKKDNNITKFENENEENIEFTKYSSFMETKNKLSNYIDNLNMKCLSLFNPLNMEDYNYIIEMWIKSIFRMLKKVMDFEKK